MSIITCYDCGQHIDSDDNPEAYSEWTDKWRCETCREDAEEEFPPEFNFSFGTPPHKLHRTTDPDTSVESAQKVNTSKLERIVLDEIVKAGIRGTTYSELVRILVPRGVNGGGGSISGRFKSLEEKGLIVRPLGDEHKRLNQNNRNERIMYATVRPLS